MRNWYVVGNLLENYWFLDSFGADLVFGVETVACVDLRYTGLGGNCADGCCIKCLQFVQQFWEKVWYN